MRYQVSSEAESIYRDEEADYIFQFVRLHIKRKKEDIKAIHKTEANLER